MVNAATSGYQITVWLSGSHIMKSYFGVIIIRSDTWHQKMFSYVFICFISSENGDKNDFGEHLGSHQRSDVLAVLQIGNKVLTYFVN